MVGYIIAANKQKMSAAYEADGKYGYLEIVSATSLSVDDVICGKIGTLGRTLISINGEDSLKQVQICEYDIPREEAIQYTK